MNRDQILKIQSHVDCELTEDDAREIQALLSQDADANALSQELRATASLLRANEPLASLGESREFYWSKIEREIRAQAVTPSRFEFATALAASWRKMLVPVAGAAAALAFILFSSPGLRTVASFGEIETPSEDMGALTFRDHAAGVTMVWVYNRGPSEFTEPTPAGSFLDQ
jgi:hypothetical protein